MAFGLYEDRHNTRFPDDRLIESQDRVDIWHLNRCGALTEGAVVELGVGTVGHLARMHEGNLWIGDKRVPIVHDGLARPWFEERDGSRTRFLYFPELGSRRELGLDWACRHRHRSLPAIHRVLKLRRMAGVDPHPFGPIPRRQPRYKRYHRLVARLQAAEAELLGHLQKVCHDLKHRARLRGMLPK